MTPDVSHCFHLFALFLTSTRPFFPCKVQRPGVVEMIAMDVFILRYLAAVLR